MPPASASDILRPLRGRIAKSAKRHDLLGPVLVTAAVLIALVGARLSEYDGDPTGFVQFGGAAAAAVGPPAGALVSSEIGYDGQFFYVQATDPLLRDRARAALVATNGEYRAQRALYPGLAHVTAGGNRDALPWSMLALNVLAVLGATAAAAVFARARGRSGWWALAIGLNPAMVLPVLRDMGEPVAVAALVAGLVAWRLGRPGAATFALTAAVLARELMLIGVLAVAVEACWRRWTTGRADTLRMALPVCLVPAAAFLGWQAYLTARFDDIAALSTPENQFGLPSEGILDSVSTALSEVSSGGLWDLGFLVLMTAAVAIAFARLRRGLAAPCVAAGCFAVVLVFVNFGADHWNYTRLAAPMMASLTLVGLEEDNDPALVVTALTALLTLLVPVAFSASAGA